LRRKIHQFGIDVVDVLEKIHQFGIDFMDIHLAENFPEMAMESRDEKDNSDDVEVQHVLKHPLTF
jgi:hypothetical protein